MKECDQHVIGIPSGVGVVAVSLDIAEIDGSTGLAIIGNELFRFISHHRRFRIAVVMHVIWTRLYPRR